MSAIGDAEQRAREFVTFCDGMEACGFETFARRGRVVADDLLRALERLRSEHAARVKIREDHERALQAAREPCRDAGAAVGGAWRRPDDRLRRRAAGGERRVSVLRDLNRLVPRWQDLALPEIEERLDRFGVNGDGRLALVDLAADLQALATTLEPEQETPADGDGPALRWVTLDEFVSVDEPGAEALVGERGDALAPQGGDLMFYGEGGAGKTTLEIDLAFHLAAGDDWLGQAIPRPVRVGLVENEGPRPHFREKLRRKRAAWAGSPIGGRLRILETPWAQLTLDDEDHARSLAAAIATLELDVVMVGPVTRSGMNEAGTLQETRDYMNLVAAVRWRSGRPVLFVLVHHENRAGQVSGAWEGVVDTLLHVQPQGHGKTRLFVQKARWAPSVHKTALQLLWADGEGFTVEEKPELDDDTFAETLVAAIRANPGEAWRAIEQQTKGVGRDYRMTIRDRLLAAGRIVNVARVDGADVALDHLPERRPSRLHVADDPAIAHLLLTPGAGQEQAAPATGAGTQMPLLRAPGLIEEHGAGAAGTHPHETAEPREAA